MHVHVFIWFQIGSAPAIINVHVYPQGRWRGVLHHVTDSHEWFNGQGDAPPYCEHGEMDKQRPWLEKDSAPHCALRKVMFDKRFLNTVQYYVNFRWVAHSVNLYIYYVFFYHDNQ